MTPATEQTARYLEEVLLQPDQVNDVALTAAEPAAQDAAQHPHGDY